MLLRVLMGTGAAATGTAAGAAATGTAAAAAAPCRHPGCLPSPRQAELRLLGIPAIL